MPQVRRHDYGAVMSAIVWALGAIAVLSLVTDKCNPRQEAPWSYLLPWACYLALLGAFFRWAL